MHLPIISHSHDSIPTIHSLHVHIQGREGDAAAVAGHVLVSFGVIHKGVVLPYRATPVSRLTALIARRRYRIAGNFWCGHACGHASLVG
ncbi:hypothetical protein E2C01_098343 [Portunus trituberculatus]|uniref:Uncharacterized protein n=1 Tax=Portunus trituberculatus TaxID=210409 RepID=A0A5B7JXK6_PORTR|nr:hypothetical protein [Portunus trituberculatus]